MVRCFEDILFTTSYSVRNLAFAPSFMNIHLALNTLLGLTTLLNETYMFVPRPPPRPRHLIHTTL